MELVNVESKQCKYIIHLKKTPTSHCELYGEGEGVDQGI